MLSLIARKSAAKERKEVKKDDSKSVVEFQNLLAEYIQTAYFHQTHAGTFFVNSLSNTNKDVVKQILAMKHMNSILSLLDSHLADARFNMSPQDPFIQLLNGFFSDYYHLFLSLSEPAKAKLAVKLNDFIEDINYPRLIHTAVREFKESGIIDHDLINKLPAESRGLFLTVLRVANDHLRESTFKQLNIWSDLTDNQKKEITHAVVSKYLASTTNLLSNTREFGLLKILASKFDPACQFDLQMASTVFDMLFEKPKAEEDTINCLISIVDNLGPCLSHFPHIYNIIAKLLKQLNPTAEEKETPSSRLFASTLTTISLYSNNLISEELQHHLISFWIKSISSDFSTPDFEIKLAKLIAKCKDPSQQSDYIRKIIDVYRTNKNEKSILVLIELIPLMKQRLRTDEILAFRENFYGTISTIDHNIHASFTKELTLINIENEFLSVINHYVTLFEENNTNISIIQSIIPRIISYLAMDTCQKLKERLINSLLTALTRHTDSLVLYSIVKTLQELKPLLTLEDKQHLIAFLHNELKNGAESYCSSRASSVLAAIQYDEKDCQNVKNLMLHFIEKLAKSTKKPFIALSQVIVIQIQFLSENSSLKVVNNDNSLDLFKITMELVNLIKQYILKNNADNYIFAKLYETLFNIVRCVPLTSQGLFEISLSLLDLFKNGPDPKSTEDLLLEAFKRMDFTHQVYLMKEVCRLNNRDSLLAEMNYIYQVGVQSIQVYSHQSTLSIAMGYL